MRQFTSRRFLYGSSYRGYELRRYIQKPPDYPSVVWEVAVYLNGRIVRLDSFSSEQEAKDFARYRHNKFYSGKLANY